MNFLASFTKEPQSLLLASLGSNVTFRWDFTYGKVGHLKMVVIWGKVDNYGNFEDKFITVTPPRTWAANTQVPSSITSRLHWSGNFNQNGSVQLFTLRNVGKSDEIDYACKVIMDGTTVTSALVKLLIRGK